MTPEQQELVIDFKDQLCQLLHPTKHIINGLTYIAADQESIAHELVAAIEKRILTAPPEHVLPPLYVLDSIVKNVGGVYLSAFSARLLQIFTTVFQHAGARERQQLHKLLTTWPDVFAADLLARIRQRVDEIQPPSQSPPVVPLLIQPPAAATALFVDQSPVTFPPPPAHHHLPQQQPAAWGVFPQPAPVPVAVPFFGGGGAAPMVWPPYAAAPAVSNEPVVGGGRAASDVEVATVRTQLYHAPNQCHRCGFRFFQKKLLDEHLDWHYRMKKRENMQLKNPMSRQWFLTVSEWLDDPGYETQVVADSTPFFGQAAAAAKDAEPEITTVLVGNREHGECLRCGDHFDKKWDSDQQEWVFVDAIASGDDLYHPKCLMSDTHDGHISDDEVVHASLDSSMDHT